MSTVVTGKFAMSPMRNEINAQRSRNFVLIIIEGSLEVKLLTIWTYGKVSKEESQKREDQRGRKSEVRRSERRKSEERGCRCAKP